MQHNGFGALDIDSHGVNLGEFMLVEDVVEGAGGYFDLLNVEATSACSVCLSSVQRAQTGSGDAIEGDRADASSCRTFNDRGIGSMDAQVGGQYGISLDQETSPSLIVQRRRDGQVPGLVGTDVDVHATRLPARLLKRPPDAHVLAILRERDPAGHPPRLGGGWVVERHSRHRASGVPENHENCAHTVAPSDLLALGVGPPGVGDPHFVDSAAHARHLAGDFGFETEPILFELDRLNHFTLEHLGAGLHVGEIDVGHHVGERREDPVADAVPVVEDTVLRPAHETGAVNHVGTPITQGRKQSGKLRGVVFQICIMDGDVGGRREGKATTQRSTLALIHFARDDPKAGVGDLPQKFHRPVLRAVVDGDEFVDEFLRENPRHSLLNSLLLVVDRHDHAHICAHEVTMPSSR